MSDEQARLQAVLSAPDEDAPRLDYAKWCEDQGDPSSLARAELIRTQLELAHADPEHLATGRLFGEQHRAEQLVAVHGDAGFQPATPWVDGFRFHRGFVEWIRLSARSFLDHGERIFELAPVRHMDLTAVRDVDEALADSPLLANVRSLAMDSCGLHDLHVQLLAASPHVINLRWLSLADNNLTLAAAEALAASPHLGDLRYAELRGNPVDPGERLGLDGGEVVASWMPPEGRDLEARFGPQRWLHREPIVGRFD